MSKKPISLRRLVPALLMLLLLACATSAGARPAGPSGIGPLIAGEEPASLEKPEDQGTPAGTEVSLAIKGTELVQLKAEGLPAGLTLKEQAPGVWAVTGAPTTIAPAATVTLTAENPGHGPPSVTTFSWSVGGILAPPSTKTIALAPVKIPVTGVELKTLSASPLPPGLELKDGVSSPETEWEIVGAATQTGLTQITLEGQNAKGEPLTPVKFTFGVVGADNPGPQTGTVGIPLGVPIKGVEMAEVTAVKIPAGLKLEDPAGSEFEWRIVGTATTAGSSEVVLEVKTPSKETELLSFTLTIAEAEHPPAPTPPSATGTLRISPAGAFSAARATCSGLSWSPATVSTRWLLDGVAIPGATAATYVAPRMDDGHQLSCRQTAVSAEGASASLTSAAASVHEQPPQPSWPIGSASQRCSSPVCMQDGESPQTPVTRTYQQGGNWAVASQIRCISAPWTSIAGTSGLAAVESFAEAHAVTMTLTRTTPAGTVTVVSRELGNLTSASEGIDGAVAGSPFAGNIVASFGPQTFTAGELWARLFAGSLGKADRFAAGQGYIAYQVAAKPTAARSFQLIYNLTAQDLGAHLRCSVSAEDGPLSGPTGATLSSPEYAVSSARSCAPRSIAHIGGPQPAVVVIGTRVCLQAPSGMGEIGNGPRDLSVLAGRSAVALECTLASGCSGKLTLGSAGHNLAGTTVAVAHGARKVVSLKLTPQGRTRLKRAGSAGLAASLNLVGKSSKRRLSSVKLLAIR